MDMDTGYDHPYQVTTLRVPTLSLPRLLINYHTLSLYSQSLSLSLSHSLTNVSVLCTNLLYDTDLPTPL